MESVNRVRRGERVPRGETRREAEMRILLQAHGLDGFVQEHRFHPTRKWRLDFAWLDEKVAIEVDGLVHGGRGGHQTVDGIEADAEKYEAAQSLGWIVYRVPGTWLDTRCEQVIAGIRGLLRLRTGVQA